MNYKISEYKTRFFIGVEYEGGVKSGSNPKLGELWNIFLSEDLKLLIDVPNYEKFIGLECYPPDFKDLKTFDYYALLETKELVKKDGFVSKKLPKGKYIEFEINFDNLHDEMQKVYQYVKENNLTIHYGFDYEDYLKGQDYNKDDAILNFVLKLEE
jgi:predicted transcriptional regulator YdeE